MLEFSFSETFNIKLMETQYVNKYLEFVQRNRDHLINWVPFISKVKGIDEINDYIEKYLEKSKNGVGALYGLWENKELIGSVVIREMDKEAKWAEIGYMIDEKYQGKGITKRA
jgi:ribosomal-protein-serine acetyltransferase